MSSTTALGHSHHYSPTVAVAQALAQIQTTFSKDKPQYLWVFALQGRYQLPELMAELKRQAGSARIMGSTVGFPIQSNLECNVPLLLLALTTDDSHIAITSQHTVYSDLTSFTSSLFRSLRSNMQNTQAAWALALPPYHPTKLYEMAATINADVSRVKPLSGACLGFPSAPASHWQFFDRQALQNNTILISGSLPSSLRVVSSNNWTAIGLIKTITKTQGQIIQELDHLPALKLYTDQLGLPTQATAMTGQPHWLWQYPLMIYKPNQPAQLIIPTLNNSELLSPIPITIGDRLALATLTAQNVSQETLTSSQQLAQQFGTTTPKLIIALSSYARQSVTSDYGETETAIIKGVFGNNVPVILLRTSSEWAPTKDPALISFLQGSFVIAGLV